MQREFMGKQPAYLTRKLRSPGPLVGMDRGDCTIFEKSIRRLEHTGSETAPSVPIERLLRDKRRAYATTSRFAGEPFTVWHPSKRSGQLANDAESAHERAFARPA